MSWFRAKNPARKWSIWFHSHCARRNKGPVLNYGLDATLFKKSPPLNLIKRTLPAHSGQQWQSRQCNARKILTMCLRKKSRVEKFHPHFFRTFFRERAFQLNSLSFIKLFSVRGFFFVSGEKLYPPQLRCTFFNSNSSGKSPHHCGAPPGKANAQKMDESWKFFLRQKKSSRRQMCVWGEREPIICGDSFARECGKLGPSECRHRSCASDIYWNWGFCGAFSSLSWRPPWVQSRTSGQGGVGFLEFRSWKLESF